MCYLVAPDGWSVCPDGLRASMCPVNTDPEEWGWWSWLATNNSQIWERIICLVSNMAFYNLSPRYLLDREQFSSGGRSAQKPLALRIKMEISEPSIGIFYISKMLALAPYSTHRNTKGQVEIRRSWLFTIYSATFTVVLGKSKE